MSLRDESPRPKRLSGSGVSCLPDPDGSRTGRSWTRWLRRPATLRRSAATTEDDRCGPTPQIIVYNYRIAGVTYECAQDVTALAEYVHGIRTDLPIQVRYLPQNPANSIVVAESWSGLRLSSSHPYQAD